jgi:undecaprenyl-diphosphatase
MPREGKATERVQRQALRSLAAIAAGGALVATVFVAAGWALAALAPAKDDAVVEWAAGQGGRAGELVTLTLSRLGDVPGVVLALLVALAVARRRHRWCDLALVGVAATTEFVVFLVVSELVGRSRPDVSTPDAAPLTGSFPSGHAAIAVVILGGLALLVPPATRRLRAIALATAALGSVLVAGSRLVRGQHRLSEVVAGLALGAVVLVLVHAVARRDGWAPGVDETRPRRHPAIRAASRSCA